LTRDEIAAREAANGLRQADRMFEMIDHAIAAGKFRLRPSTLIELNRLAVKGLVAAPGAFRTGPMIIEKSEHVPPSEQDVAGYVDDLCDYVASEWESSYATHLAAYVLWRLNWIHPFEDGNGRTARAASYLALSIKLGHKLPGTLTIPEFIARDKTRYYRALEAADSAWKLGKLDLKETEEVLKSCLAAQLVDVVQRASAPNMLSQPAKDETPKVAVVSGENKPRVFVGSSTEGPARCRGNSSWARV
jgi:Fic family protein